VYGVDPEPQADAGARARARASELRELVAINEAAKELCTRSFQVKLLALNAMITSMQDGVVLPAFTEVASRMRTWATELQATTDRLVACTSDGVGWVSAKVERDRIGRILTDAARMCARPRALDGARERLVDRVAALQGSLERSRHAIHGCLHELAQSGLMATVLSRSALIEATRAPASIAAALSQVARDFADAGHRVLAIITELRDQTERR